MTKLFEVYKCEVCGNITKVVHASGGTMVCCGKPMTLQQEKNSDQGKEKHYIEWIEVRSGNNVSVKWLLPGEKPEAEFCISDINMKARAYCNVHGLWTNRL
jgi:superoxide reductase